MYTLVESGWVDDAVDVEIVGSVAVLVAVVVGAVEIGCPGVVTSSHVMTQMTKKRMTMMTIKILLDLEVIGIVVFRCYRSMVRCTRIPVKEQLSMARTLDFC